MLEWRFKLIKALAFIHKKNSLSQESFQSYYEKQHAPLAKSLLTFESYERNYVESCMYDSDHKLGSISIFKYASEKSLSILAEQMASTPGDILRKDELNFMAVSLNFYVFTDSIEDSKKDFKRKIFYIAREKNELSALDGMAGIQKISDNLIKHHQEIVGIPEYGVSRDFSLGDLEKVANDLPDLILTSAFN